MSSTAETDKHEALLGALQQVRLIGSIAKVDATVDIAKKTLETEPAGTSKISHCAILINCVFALRIRILYIPAAYFYSRDLYKFRKSGQECSSKARESRLGRRIVDG